MKKYSFSLHAGDTGPLVKGTDPDKLAVPIHAHTPTMKIGDQVLAGSRIATANRPELGDLHAALAGTIANVDNYAMTIETTDGSRAESTKPPAESGEPLKQWLRENGVDVSGIKQAATLIINGVPPEPGISIYEPLLRDYRKTIELGLDTIEKIVTPSKMYLVAAKGNRANAFANCSVMHVQPVYPNGIDQMVIKAVTGQEVIKGAQPDNVALVSVRDLYTIGRVMETGRPVTETVMTINGQNHLVKVGTPVGFLANEAGWTIGTGDKVIMGGFMQGMAALNLDQGVGKYTTGLNLMPKGQGLTTTDNFCLGCGECERRCPARIMPGMISRCAEFKQFARAEDFHIHSCFECGICGYWCKAQRPLLQYIRLAKYEIALLRSATSTLQALNESPDTGDVA